TLVFYVAKEPPGTLLGQLRKRLKEEAGVTYPIEIRVNPDAEAEPAEGEAAAAGAAAAPGTSGGPRAAWEKALAEVQPPHLPGLRDQPDKASARRAVMGFAQGKAQKEAYPGAIAALRKLADPLGKPPAGNGATLTAPPPPPPPDGARAAVLKRLNGLTPGVKAALAGPNAAPAQARLVAVNGLIKNSDFAQAGKVLDELEPLLAAGGAPAAGPAPAATAAEAKIAQAKSLAARYEEMYNAQLE